jgi:hypothetical protein
MARRVKVSRRNQSATSGYLSNHHDEASLISEFLVGFHGGEPPAVAVAYDFSNLKAIVDVGGATGNMLAAILERQKEPRGILYDMPHVVKNAPALLKARGVQNRVAIASGSFFSSVPTGGDAYILSHIIHDWSEEQCVTILGHCAKAMKPEGRVLIVEMVLPVGDKPGKPMTTRQLSRLFHQTADAAGITLALFGRRPPQRLVGIVIPAAENLHNFGLLHIARLSVMLSALAASISDLKPGMEHTPNCSLRFGPP